jgi:hypothetical protein
VLHARGQEPKKAKEGIITLFPDIILFLPNYLKWYERLKELILWK